MENTIQKILVPVDFTETSNVALKKAIEFAKITKSELFLLHVIEFPGYVFSILPELQVNEPRVTEIEEVVLRKMNTIRDQIFNEHGVSATLSISTGNIDDEIVEYSSSQDIDLIIMGTHGASGYKEYFVGSNAQRVVTLSEIPVLTFQSDFVASEFKSILVPIDNSLHSREKFNFASKMAKLYNAEIHILGLPDSTEKKDMDKFQIKIESVEKVLKTENISFKTTVMNGDNIAKEALSYADKNNIDLIVINTGHESEISGIFLGAFAQQIVNHSNIPVLSIKHIHGVYEITTPGFGIH